MSFKVLSAEIAHETNTFNIYPTTLKSFQDRYLLDGTQAIATRGSQNTELAGMLDLARGGIAQLLEAQRQALAEDPACRAK